MDFLKRTQELEQYTIELRRHFHQNPELSFKEEKTREKIIEEILSVGLSYEVVGSGNVVALLDTGKAGKALAIRVDSDALPWDHGEKTV